MRILEDELHLLAQRPELMLAQFGELNGAAELRARLEAHTATSDRGEPEQRASGCRLAATRLPHQAQHFALAQGERHSVDGLDRSRRPTQEPVEEPASQREVNLQVADVQDDRPLVER
jgi:hypothetical protein